MTVRENLLRLRRWRLRERQDYLAGLEALRERLRGDLRRLQDDDAAGPTPHGGGGGPMPVRPLPMRPLIERQRRIERSIVEIDSRIEEARGAVGAALHEVRLSEGPVGIPDTAGAARVVRRPRRGRCASLPPPSRGERWPTV